VLVMGKPDWHDPDPRRADSAMTLPLQASERDGYFGEADCAFELEHILGDIASDVSCGWFA